MMRLLDLYDAFHVSLYLFCVSQDILLARSNGCGYNLLISLVLSVL